MKRLMGSVLVALVLSSSALAQVETLEAKVKISPKSLNLKDKGKWITCTIRLPEGSNVADVDVSTIRLTGDIPAVKGNVDDGVLMVKFSRPAVVDYINTLGLTFPADVTLTVTGTLKDGGPQFTGQATIRAIKPGGKKK